MNRLVRWYPLWVESLHVGRSALEDQRPWMTFAAIEFLEKFLSPDATVFEWGTGGSTVFFARRAAQVESVEHDRAWFDAVQLYISKHGITNWHGKLIEPDRGKVQGDPDAGNPEHYVSSSPDFRNCCFREYAAAIDLYSDKTFDVVLVDGRARPSCVMHALSKIKIGGCLVLDNSDRDYYGRAMQLLAEGWQMIDLPGPSPYVDFFTRTTAWRRLE